MRIFPQQMRSSILIALVFGPAFIPTQALLGMFLPGSVAFRSTLWLCLAVYGGFLARKARRGLLPLTFPLSISLLLAFSGSSANLFIMISMGVLSWIRSGICFPGKILGKTVGELLLSGGGGLLACLMSSGSPLHIAMGVWLFFLVQSLYFLFIEDFDAPVHDKPDIDRFEAARIQAERILKEL